MSIYFSYFPTTKNDLEKTGQLSDVTNILRRFKVRSSIMSNSDVYYEYNIQAGDRPDTIAEKYYGSSALAWIVLLYNDITDPIFGWPLFNNDFEQYIKGKYGSIPEAQAEVHEYRKILNSQQTLTDGTIIPKRWVVVDQTTYNSLAEENRESISKYDWEQEEQERKRKINLLDERYVSQIKKEVKNILRNGA